MIEAATASTVINKLLEIIGLVRQGEIERDQKTDSALRKTHKALVETKGYLRVIEVQNRDPDKEHDIAYLWHEASVDMRHIDQELAEICFLKGGYWSNPDTWDQMKNPKHNISIENVESQLFELLKH